MHLLLEVVWFHLGRLFLTTQLGPVCLLADTTLVKERLELGPDIGVGVVLAKDVRWIVLSLHEMEPKDFSSNGFTDTMVVQG